MIQTDCRSQLFMNLKKTLENVVKHVVNMWKGNYYCNGMTDDMFECSGLKRNDTGLTGVVFDVTVFKWKYYLITCLYIGDMQLAELNVNNIKWQVLNKRGEHFSVLLLSTDSSVQSLCLLWINPPVFQDKASVFSGFSPDTQLSLWTLKLFCLFEDRSWFPLALCYSPYVGKEEMLCFFIYGGNTKKHSLLTLEAEDWFYSTYLTLITLHLGL